MLVLGSLYALLLAHSGRAAAAANPTPTSIDINRYPPDPQITACGDIVRTGLKDGPDVIRYLHASDALNCLTSVPFNSAVALRFLAYFNTTLEFQATTAFLRNPPAEYQQPPVDIHKEIQHIVDLVKAGAYHNQYAFELDVQELVQSIHDSHVVVFGGISQVFTFFSPRDFVSVSTDGIQTPQIYLYGELVDQVTYGNVSAHPVKTINDVPAADFLESFAKKQAFGMVEPHADWNLLMYSPAQEIFGSSSISDAAALWPGDIHGDRFVITFEDLPSGSRDTINERWLAIYSDLEDTGPLETGGDFYNYYVLGLRPNVEDPNYPSPDGPVVASSYSVSTITAAARPTIFSTTRSASIETTAPSVSPMQETNTATENVENPDPDDGDRQVTKSTSWHQINLAYPDQTMVHQQDLGQFDTGSVTGYFLETSQTAVLSIPTFDFEYRAIDTFSRVIADFLGNATLRNAKHVVIDLQQNTGGQVGAAIYLFKQFFPDQTPYTGSNRRSFALADVLGYTTTAQFLALLPKTKQELETVDDADELEYLDYITSEWVATTRNNTVTGQPFASWDELSGPIDVNGDSFGLTEQYDLDSAIFNAQILDVPSDRCVDGLECEKTPRWDPQSIVILTDGVCGSTCSLFVEMMHQAGVRSVAIGGQPRPGPMQAASGTRAAVQYSDGELVDDFLDVGYLNTTAAALVPSSLQDPGMSVSYIGLSLRSQLRRNATIPNQVLYLPADCRLYWTTTNFHNYTQLWTDVYTAMFQDISRCVPGSYNASTAPVPSTSPPKPINMADYIIYPFASSDHMDLFQIDDGNPSSDFSAPNVREFCGIEGGSCRKVAFPCVSDEGLRSQRDYFMVLKAAQSIPKSACGSDKYRPFGPVTSVMNGITFAGYETRTQGYCFPELSSTNLRCAFIATGQQLVNQLQTSGALSDSARRYGTHGRLGPGTSLK